MGLLELSKLPVPDVIEELDYEQILAEMKAKVIELDDSLEYAFTFESDPITKIFQALAYREILMRQKTNEAARAVMLAYAQNSDLDHLGANFNVYRVEGETDDVYRVRIQQALVGFSVAGPRQAYIYHARTAATEIDVNGTMVPVKVLDADAVSLASGSVTVYILGDRGPDTIFFLPVYYDSGPNKAVVTAGVSNDPPTPTELITATQQLLSDETIRPLCDTVNVVAATIVNYDITGVVKVEDDTNLAAIVSQIVENLNTLFASQRNFGNRFVSVSSIFAAIHVEGVLDVDLSEPVADLTVASNEVAFVENISLTFPATF